MVHDSTALVALAYRLPVAEFDIPHVSRLLREGLIIIYREAHELSLMIKRDILSSHLTVTLYPRLYHTFEKERGEQIWPGMRLRVDDTVLGFYGLGLQKRTMDKGLFYLTLPKVFTTALLREVDPGEQVKRR